MHRGMSLGQWKKREWVGTFVPPGEVPETHEGADRAMVCEYGPSGVIRYESVDADTLAALPPAADVGATVRLTVIDGLSPGPAAVAALSRLELSSLEREDLFSPVHKPKIEPLEATTVSGEGFLALMDAPECTKAGEIRGGHLSLLQQGSEVVVLQEHPLAVVGVVVDRIRSGRGRVRTMGADYVSYLILDGVIDAGSSVARALMERHEDLEQKILSGSTERAVLREIQDLLASVGIFRRTMTAFSYSLRSAAAHDGPLFTAETRPFFKDLLEHAEMLRESFEARREQTATLVPLYAAISSEGTNAVMKVLTVIATIFIPITFIAGVYGMNFVHMPELRWRWGYPVVLAVMIVIALVMVWYFRRRKWF